MSDVPQGPGWWQASDGKWYAPELHPDYQASATVGEQAGGSPVTESDQVFTPADSMPVFAADSSPVFAAADNSPVFAPADSAPVFAPADSAPVFAPADSAPVFTPADSAPVFAPADSAPVFTPADSALPSFPAAGSDPVFAVANESGPTAYPGIQYPDVPTSGNKSKVTAGLLAIFLGALGVHRFYLGYKLIGVIMLLLTVASLGRLAPLTVLWGIVEGILILTGKMKKDKYGGVLE